MTETIERVNVKRSVTPPHDCKKQWKLVCQDDKEVNRQGLRFGQNLTADHYRLLAMRVLRADGLGDDISEEVPPTILRWLRRIAYGELPAEAFKWFGPQPSILRAIAALPLPEREACVMEGVKVGIRKPDGSIDSYQAQLSDLAKKPELARKVFSSDGIRSPEAQVNWERTQNGEFAEQPPERPTWVIRNNHCVINRPTELSKRDVQNILKAMS